MVVNHIPANESRPQEVMEYHRKSGPRGDQGGQTAKLLEVLHHRLRSIRQQEVWEGVGAKTRGVPSGKALQEIFVAEEGQVVGTLRTTEPPNKLADLRGCLLSLPVLAPPLVD